MSFKTFTLLHMNLIMLLLLLTSGFQCKKEAPYDAGLKAEVIEFRQERIPLFVGRENPDPVLLKMNVVADAQPLRLTEIEIVFSSGSELKGIAGFSAGHTSATGSSLLRLSGSMTLNNEKAVLKTSADLGTGSHFLNFGFDLKENASLLTRFRIEKIMVHFSNHETVAVTPESTFTYRLARVVRAAGQDNCDTYRIPGLVTTGKGTLIAVYDNRYNNSKDLQEDIDIGMSRSIDGGETWEPMKVIMDMGEWGSRPERLNGIGDPAVLYDHTTGTIWVAALWMSGSAPDQMLWWASKPGMSPEETGQFILVKSTDDGLTWSDPINITSQIKDPAWQLLLQGPGAGITLKDGTLVFPAQFKKDTGEKALDGGQYTCHSTIVYSKDGGNTWKIGTGAKSNTTEAQVAQLSDGSLMLNMRDDRNRKDKGDTNGRAVAITRDLGKTWETHQSSNSALPEPNCMASLIAAEVSSEGTSRQVLFFSNPNHKETRTNMTIKASLDQGKTWPSDLQVELFAPAGYGYSCLTMVDDDTVGILYEGTKELYFQKVSVRDILGTNP